MNSFHSQWMDWQPKGEESPVSTVSSMDKQNSKNIMADEGSVSTVSSSEKRSPEKIINKKDLKMLFYRTDTTDSTPRILDGHVVAGIVWETDKAVVFIDDMGRYWRFLHAYGKAWPVILD